MEHKHRFSWKAHFRSSELACGDCDYRRTTPPNVRGIAGGIGAVAGTLVANCLPDVKSSLLDLLWEIPAFLAAYMLVHAAQFLILSAKYRRA